MSRLRRFENLEKSRPERGRRSRALSLDERFGEADSRAMPKVREGSPESETRGLSAEDRGPSASLAARFEPDPTSDDRLRVLDIGDGSPFVRCARCRRDNFVTARACGSCGADLETPEQRAFNEALWIRHREEREEEREELERLRAARANADREAAEAVRLWTQVERQLAARRALRLPPGVEAIRGPMRALGHALGARLRRTFPRRNQRLAFLAALAAANLALFVFAAGRISPQHMWGSYHLFLALALFCCIGPTVALVAYVASVLRRKE